MYVAVIDFEKVFGLISYRKLWPIRLKYGLNGKMYFAIQSMCRVVNARVRCGKRARFTDLVLVSFFPIPLKAIQRKQRQVFFKY